MQAAAVITLVVFFAWLSTLGYRLAASNGPAPAPSQTAAALSAVGSPAEEAGFEAAPAESASDEYQY